MRRATRSGRAILEEKMKVILFNGSRNEKGSTYTSLKIVADALVENGIEAEIFWVDGRALSGEM